MLRQTLASSLAVAAYAMRLADWQQEGTAVEYETILIEAELKTEMSKRKKLLERISIRR